MACLPCQRQRQALVRSAKALDVRGVTRAVTTAVAINVDKLRGVDAEKKYGAVPQAQPYRRKVT